MKLIKKPKDVFFGVRMLTSSRMTRHKQHSFDLTVEAIKSLEAQTYKDWKLYLVGDLYEDQEKFNKLARLLPKDKVVAYNLKGHQPERNYFKEWGKLTKVAGTTASIFSVELMKATGIRYIANLDDDDLWTRHHLELVAAEYRKFPAPAFVTTLANWQYFGIIPGVTVDDKGNYEMVPLKGNINVLPGNISHSAATWDSKKLPFNYRNRLISTPWAEIHGDYDMWDVMESHCKDMGYRIALVPEVTVEYR